MLARLLRGIPRMNLSRRAFLRMLPATAGPFVLGARSVSDRRPPHTLRIGLVVPAREQFESAARGAAMGVAEARRVATMLGGDVSLHRRPDARHLIAADRVQVLIGGFDEASSAELTEFAERHELLFLNIGCTSDLLRSGVCSRHAFHVAASEAMLRDALALLEHATRGEIAVWHGSLERYGAAQVNDRYRAEFRAPMDSLAWSAWMAVKIVAEAAVRLRGFETQRVTDWLEDPRTRFDGHKGRALSFRAWDHQLRQPLFWIDHSGGPVLELPPVERGASAGASAAEQLDRIGTSAAASTCRWPAE